MSAMGTSLSFDEIPFITRVANFAYVTLYLIPKKTFQLSIETRLAI